ncbi:uncharacterized protein LOC135345265 [Halichondria panicea]|uniref:uncharacterized protein LOC135345265 n=1 Tax=Halichondria panicea TaxID=6063 RepID=UPI00312B4158
MLHIMLRITFSFLCLLFVIESHTRLVEATPDCLHSRVDEFPCTPRHPRTKMPSANEFGNYNTKIVSFGRLSQCDILNFGHQVLPIPGNGSTMFISSPGITLNTPKNYSNQKYVVYNISCPAGHLAFFDMTTMQLERANCFHPGKNQMVCRDYVRVNRPGYGYTESCGYVSNQDNQNQLEEGTMTILFRTSVSNRYPGFEATIICFNPEDANQLGCTQNNHPGQDNLERRRADLDEFHRTWMRQRHDMLYRQRGVGAIRFERINVSFGVRVLYNEGKLSFMVEDGMMKFRESIDGIIYLAVFHSNGSRIVYFRGQSRIFRGPGPMWIVGPYAYFQHFAIDPRGILPNPEELVAIGSITAAQRTLIQEDNKRYVKKSDMLTNSAILTAIENENACNPVLRTSAVTTITLVQRENPQRLTQLRYRKSHPSSSESTSLP